jgi:hypothetical protein
VLQGALRARPEQFAEIESGHYFNLDGILAATLTATPELAVRSREPLRAALSFRS